MCVCVFFFFFLIYQKEKGKRLVVFSWIHFVVLANPKPVVQE